MTWLSPTLLFVVAWLAVFAQTQFGPVRAWLDTPLSCLPALLVYSGLRHHLAVTTSLAVLAGLGLDSLSTTRLGVSVLPLFLTGFAVDACRHLLLRDQFFAQFLLGAVAGLVTPLLALAVLAVGSRDPLAGWGTLWQLLLLAAFNGVMCPVCFRLFEWFRRTFEYQPVSPSSFRPDREIKYGKR